MKRRRRQPRTRKRHQAMSPAFQGPRIVPTQEGFELSLPPQKTLKALFIPVGSIGIVLLGLLAVVPDVAPLLPMLVILGTWILVEARRLGRFVQRLFGREKIILTPHELRVEHHLLWKNSEQVYPLKHIRNLQLTPYDPEGTEKFIFDYQARSIRCGRNLNHVEAAQVFQQLQTILTARCHVVEHIIFSTQEPPENGVTTTLYNPDVSTLTFPFVRLHSIIIDTNTYEVHDVERFLTYALNVLGQAYVKQHVEGHVYGDPQLLQENVRNLLTNLCKCVVLHDAEERWVS